MMKQHSKKNIKIRKNKEKTIMKMKNGQKKVILRKNRNNKMIQRKKQTKEDEGTVPVEKENENQYIGGNEKVIWNSHTILVRLDTFPLHYIPVLVPLTTFFKVYRNRMWPTMFKILRDFQQSDSGSRSMFMNKHVTISNTFNHTSNLPY